MATTDTELIAEVRSWTDYDAQLISDAEIQELIDIGKDEIRAEIGRFDLTFYQDTSQVNTLVEDRALFWFVVIGAQCRVGELSGLELTVGDIEIAHEENAYADSAALTNFVRRISSARAGTARGLINIERTDRTYGG